MSDQERDRAARKAIEDRRVLGTPFVLYLGQGERHALHGKDGTARETVEALLQKAVPTGVNVVSVRDQNGWHENVALTDAGAIAATPGLLLSDDERETTVRDLIDLADMIVAEITRLSPAVLDELTWCIEAEKTPQTILILPPVDGSAELLDPHPVIQRFVRCIWANALDRNSLNEMFAFADLLQRLVTLNNLTPAERQKALSDADRRNLYPVALGGLADGLMNSASQLQTFHGDGGHNEELATHQAFWSYLRAIAVFKHQANTLKLFDIGVVSDKLADCYIKAGYILLNANHPGAGEFADIGMKYAKQSGQWWLIELAEGLARRVGIPGDDSAGLSDDGNSSPGRGEGSALSAGSAQSRSSGEAPGDMELHKKLAIVVVPPNDKGYRVLLMRLSGKSEFDFEDSGFILSEQPTRDAQIAYAVGLAELLQVRVMEIK
jgi:hypothetical protein